MALDVEAARECARRARRASSGSTAEAAALAVVRTADENMANAIRLIAVERGLDPRDFALIAFGGAGPLHARAVAERLDMPTVLVPPHPGLCSAFGAAIAAGARRPRADLLRPLGRGRSSTALAAAERRLREDAVAELRRNVDVGRADRPAVGRPPLRGPELRARGRRCPDGELDERAGQTLLDALRRRARAPVRLLAAGRGRRADQPPGHGAAAGACPCRSSPMRARTRRAARAPRRLVRRRTSPVDCPIYRRASLAAGHRARRARRSIEEPDSTTLVFAGDRLRRRRERRARHHRSGGSR